MMKQIFRILGVFCFLLVFTTVANAQDPAFSQFYANPLYLNPAFAGASTGGCPRTTLNYRDQWPGIGRTYVTYSVSYDQHINALGGGLGIIVAQDRSGAGNLNTSHASLLYSYHLPISSKFSVKAGFEASYRMISLDWDDLTFGDMIDPKYGFIFPTSEDIVNNATAVNFPDFSAGFIGYSENLFFGFAAHHLTQPFDQVFIRENPDFEAAKNMILMGEVKYPGTYTLLTKDEKISSVIKRAGGLTNYAYMDGVQMFRKFEVVKEQVDEKVSISDKLIESILNNPELASIYVNDLRKNKTVQQSIFGNEDKQFAYDVVYLNMKKAIGSSNSKHNLVLIEGDSIIVPQIMDVVHITGALFNLAGNAISSPYFNRKRAKYYINNFAGGYTRDNDKSRTIVVYPNGITRKSLNFGLFAISPRVKKGSIIKVVSRKEKIKKQKENPVDWNKQIENTMLKITAVLTLWLLVDRVAPQ